MPQGRAAGRRRTTRGVVAAVAAWVALAGATAQGAPESDTVLVRVDPGPGAAAGVARALDATSSVGLSAGWRVYTLPQAATLARVREDLAATSADRRVLLDQPVQAVSITNDPYADMEWGLNNTGATLGGQAGVADADIDAPEAWAQAGTPAGVVVAVVDTGVDFTNPDLADVAWDNPELPGTHGWDVTTGAAFTTSPDTHGTHVAGTIAAHPGNGEGVAGVAPNARVMSVKALKADGTGNLSDAMIGIDWASRHGARVINASFGASGAGASVICDVVNAAVARGTLVVAAAGNSAANVDATPFYPAACTTPGLISVAATDNRDALASFSNRGTTGVDLAAPGVWIASTVPGGYGAMSGTSMAAPHVTGVAALLRGVDTGADVLRIRRALLQGVDALPGLASAVATGGRLNAAGSLAVLRTVPAADTSAPPAPTGLSPAADGLVDTATPMLAWQPSDDADSGISRYELTLDGARYGGDLPSTTTSLVASRLADGMHTWSVVAVNGAGLASPVAQGRFRVLTEALPPVTPLAPANGLATGSQVTFTWSAPAVDGLRHTLLVDELAVGDTGGDRLTVSGLRDGVHRWRVRSTDALGRTATTDTRMLLVVPVATPASPAAGAAPGAPAARPVARCSRGRVARRVRVAGTWRVRCVRVRRAVESARER